MNEPTFRSVLATGLPGFLVEGFVPLAAFYAAWRVGGLAAGIVASTVVSALIYAAARRAGKDGMLVRLSLVFVLVQSAIGLVAHSQTVYLATPVLANAAWALAFLVSAAIRRPLAGVLACAWYPFPPEFRATDRFKRVYGVESVVWGLYLLARSALRLVALRHGVGDFLVVNLVTGTPVMLGLVAWSIWYAIRRFGEDDRKGNARPLGQT